MELVEGKILQRAELFLVQKGKARHIRHWKDLLTICQEKGIKPDCHSWTYKDGHEFPPKGEDIEKWPEENSNHNVGLERIMWCVGPDCDFKRLKELGVTVIQAYDIYWQPDYGRDYLNKAKKRGLKVLYYLGALTQYLIREGKAWRKDECERIIRLFDGHEALWGWQSWDEPDSDNPDFVIPMQIQRDVCDVVKANSVKSFVNTLRGGTRKWHLVDLNLWDIIMPAFYAYNGTGEIWGEKPLVALENSAKQCSEYLKDYDKPVIWTFQCCDEPAVNHDPPMLNTEVPLGHIEEQFNVINKYNLFTGGPSLWAWDHGYFGPETSPKMYKEIKKLFEKIKG